MTRTGAPGSAFDPVGLAEIAGMLGVSHQRAGQIMDRRLHPDAPEGVRLKRGIIWSKRDVAAYLLSLGRPDGWS